MSLFGYCRSLFSLMFSVFWSILRPMFSLYCRVSLYAWVKVEKLARIQIDQFVLKILVCFFVGKLVNLGLSLLHFWKTLPKSACFEACFDSDFICRVVSAFFPERSGWFPKDRIQGEGKPKNSKYFAMNSLFENAKKLILTIPCFTYCTSYPSK